MIERDVGTMWSEQRNDVNNWLTHFTNNGRNCSRTSKNQVTIKVMRKSSVVSSINLYSGLLTTTALHFQKAWSMLDTK